MAMKGSKKAKKAKKRDRPRSAASAQKRPRHPGGPARGGVSSMLHPTWARVAGIVTLALHVLVLAALVVGVTYLGTHDQARGPTPWAFIAAILICGGVCAVSVSLLMGQEWAQRVLLGYWLLAAAWQVLSGISALLWGIPAELGAFTSLAMWIVIGAMLLGLVIAGGMVVLTVLASASASRLRYAAMAAVTVVVAIIVMATVNLMAHKERLRADFEALGRYGVSEWSENVLEGVNEPLRLTCIYTSTKKNEEGEEYRPQVLELLDDIADRLSRMGKKVEVRNVTTPAEKAGVIADLKERLRKRVSQRVAFLEGFAAQRAELTALLEKERGRWSSLPRESYLELWRLPQQYKELLGERVTRLQEIAGKVAEKMGSGEVVAYDDLIGDVRLALEEMQSGLKDACPVLKRLAEVGEEVGKNGKSALAAVGKLADDFAAMGKALGEKGKVSDPKAALSKFAKAAAAARVKAQEVARTLAEVGGKDNTDYLVEASVWRVQVQNQPLTLSGVFTVISRQLGDMAANTEGIIQVLTVDAMHQQVDNLRARVAQFKSLYDSARARAGEAIDALSAVDPATRSLMDDAAKDKLFAPVLDKVSSLLKAIKKMPKIKEEAEKELATGAKLTGEGNLVIVEVGERFQIAGFDEVFPMRERMPGADEEEGPDRVFSGDSPITSKVLSMMRKPFATVYLTYLPPFRRSDVMQMMRMGMQMGRTSMPAATFSPARMEALSRRLREANFEVKEWALNEDLEPPEDPDRPQVLIVLPPSPPSASDPLMQMMMSRFRAREWGDEHVARIRAAVDGGVRAVFLTGWARWSSRFGPPRFQQVNNYLKDDWGIKVRSRFRALAGVPDQSRPGMFRVDVLSFSYLPVSTFTDHPIGEPLQGQRMLWTEACPLEPVRDDEDKVDLPEGVTQEPLLRVVEGRRDIWCPKELDELFRAVEEEKGGGLVRPGGDDIRAPFTLALVAEREGKDAKNAGASTLTRDDIRDWNALRDKLAEADDSTEAGPAKAVWDLLDQETRKILKDASDGDSLTDPQKALVAAALDRVLAEPDLYEPKEEPPSPPPGAPPPPEKKGNFDEVALPLEAARLFHREQEAKQAAEKDEDKEKDEAKKPAKPLTETERRRMNRLVLEAAFPKIIASSQSRKPNKIVVVGMGASFFDFHLDRGVPKLTSGTSGTGISFDPPPKVDADLVVSSVYWLTGNKEYIAAGPTIVKPVNISAGTKTALWILCVIGLPVLVAALGVVVMFVRRS